MTSRDPVAVSSAFAVACASGDEEQARALVAERSWGLDHGDTASRLFAKANHPQRGFLLSVCDAVAGANSSRAAVRVEVIVDHEARGELHLLGQGTPWRIEAVTKKPLWVDAFLVGKVPALLDFDSLPIDSDAADSLVAISALSLQAARGSENAAALVSSLMNESADAYKVVGWLQNAARTGLQVRVRDARRVGGLGRSVVRASITRESREQPIRDVWLYARSGPPLQWYAQTTYFSPDTLLSS